MLTAFHPDTAARTRFARLPASRCRRLYHAAPRSLLAAILRDGLHPRDVALSPTLFLLAVWLTDDAHACTAPGGLDLRPAERATLGFDPGALLDGGAEPVRVAVRVPLDDRRLVPWARWAPRHLPAPWCAILASCGAVRMTGWYLFRGRVPAAWIAAEAPAPLPSRLSWTVPAHPLLATGGQV